MILILMRNSGEETLQEVIGELEKSEGIYRVIQHKGRNAVFVENPEGLFKIDEVTRMQGVERVIPLDRDPEFAIPDERRSRIETGNCSIGDGEIEVFAGPCSIESLDQALAIAHSVREAGVKILRGGAYKPRSSPYYFQGLGERGLEILSRVREETGLLICTEALGVEHLDLVYEHSDFIQIGSRNMQNTPLLKAVGALDKPVVLKRGMAATLKEWLQAAEYIFSEGNENIILCERGIRTFSDHGRFTLDLSVVPAIRDSCPYPVIVDPSHGTGNRRHIAAMSKAALAAGADGLMIEVHPSPDDSISDAPQAIDPAAFAQIMIDLEELFTPLGLHL